MASVSKVYQFIQNKKHHYLKLKPHYCWNIILCNSSASLRLLWTKMNHQTSNAPVHVCSWILMSLLTWNHVMYSQTRWWGLRSWERRRFCTAWLVPLRDPSRWWGCWWWHQTHACSWDRRGALRPRQNNRRGCNSSFMSKWVSKNHNHNHFVYWLIIHHLTWLLIDFGNFVPFFNFNKCWTVNR